MAHRKLIMSPGFVAAALLALSGVAGAQSPIGDGLGAGSPLIVAPGIAVPDVGADPAEPCDSEEASGTDTDNIQEGDQTGPDEASGPEEVDGPDTDNLQEGDQTGPDEACTTDPMAGVDTLASFTSAVTVQTSALKVNQSRAAVTADAVSAEQDSGSETSAESDGPGGHEDAGSNADHQFEGEE